MASPLRTKKERASGTLFGKSISTAPTWQSYSPYSPSRRNSWQNKNLTVVNSVRGSIHHSPATFTTFTAWTGVRGPIHQSRSFPPVPAAGGGVGAGGDTVEVGGGAGAAVDAGGDAAAFGIVGGGGDATEVGVGGGAAVDAGGGKGGVGGEIVPPEGSTGAGSH